MIKSVLVGGGSGFIGTRLCNTLKQKGYNVSIISRENKGPSSYTWKQIQMEGIPAGIDAIVQIPGANILQKQWTDARKKEILDSRIGTTNLLVKAINTKPNKPKVLVCASAVGIYPMNETKTFDESFSPDKEPSDFAGKVCYRWEHTLDGLDPSVRKVITRFGIVLGKNGGALKEMLPPFKFGLGGPIGSGSQYWPWVHIDDVVGIILHAINMQGVYNAVAPEIVTNQQFVKAIGKAINRPTFLPVPEFAVKLLFGESAYMLTQGQKVAPTRTLQSGYQFQHPKIEEAMQSVLK